jgi:hypothetical protein
VKVPPLSIAIRMRKAPIPYKTLAVSLVFRQRPQICIFLG